LISRIVILSTNSPKETGIKQRQLLISDGM